MELLPPPQSRVMKRWWADPQEGLFLSSHLILPKVAPWCRFCLPVSFIMVVSPLQHLFFVFYLWTFHGWSVRYDDLVIVASGIWEDDFRNVSWWHCKKGDSSDGRRVGPFRRGHAQPTYGLYLEVSYMIRYSEYFASHIVKRHTILEMKSFSCWETALKCSHMFHSITVDCNLRKRDSVWFRGGRLSVIWIMVQSDGQPEKQNNAACHIMFCGCLIFFQPQWIFEKNIQKIRSP